MYKRVYFKHSMMLYKLARRISQDVGTYVCGIESNMLLGAEGGELSGLLPRHTLRFPRLRRLVGELLKLSGIAIAVFIPWRLEIRRPSGRTTRPCPTIC